MLKRLEESKKIIIDAWEDTHSINYGMDTPEVSIWSGEAIGLNIIPKVYVLTEDRFKVAEYANDKELKALTLICNNGSSPVPSIRKGSIEHSSSFVRSNIANSFRENNILMNLKRGEIILASEVSVYKDQNFRRMKDFTTDFVFAMPMERPTVHIENGKKYYTNKSDYNYVKDVLEKVFKLGTHYHCLILDEFGCGNLENPTHEVCEIINQLIEDYPIQCVVICIKKTEQEKIVTPSDDYSNEVFQEFNQLINKL